MCVNPEEFKVITPHKLEFYEKLTQVGSKFLVYSFHMKAPPGSVHHALKTIMQDTGRLVISNPLTVRNFR
jgi:hypothetical protein